MISFASPEQNGDKTHLWLSLSYKAVFQLHIWCEAGCFLINFSSFFRCWNLSEAFLEMVTLKFGYLLPLCLSQEWMRECWKVNFILLSLHSLLQLGKHRNSIDVKKYDIRENLINSLVSLQEGAYFVYCEKAYCLYSTHIVYVWKDPEHTSCALYFL